MAVILLSVSGTRDMEHSARALKFRVRKNKSPSQTFQINVASKQLFLDDFVLSFLFFVVVMFGFYWFFVFSKQEQSCV